MTDAPTQTAQVPTHPPVPPRRRGDGLWLVGFIAVLVGVVWAIWKGGAWLMAKLGPAEPLIANPVERGLAYIAVAVVLAASVIKRGLRK
jgi:hypothetical protein